MEDVAVGNHGNSLASYLPWLAAGGLVPVLFSFWGHIKVYLSKLYGLFIVRARIDEYSVALAVSSYLIKNYKPTSWLSPRIFQGRNLFVRPVSKTELVGFKMLPDEPTLFWLGKTPIIVNLVSGGNGNGNEDNSKKGIMEIQGLRFLINIDKLVEDAIVFFNKQRSLNEITMDIDLDEFSERYTVTRFIGSGFKVGANQKTRGESVGSQPRNLDKGDMLGEPIHWKMEELGQPKANKQLQLLALDSNTEEGVREIRRWASSKEWYNKKGLSWKRGLILYGKPGTGKTSLVRGLGQELDLPIYILDIATMDDGEFSDFWNRAMVNAPCIILIEDFDTVFKGRENIVNREAGVNFESLLNHMDGVQNSEGVLTIITTNDIDALDEALGNAVEKDEIPTRPGRVDKVIHMPDTLTEEGRYKIANRLLDDFPERIEEQVKLGFNDSGAQFQERCGKLALSLYWNSKNDMESKESFKTNKETTAKNT